MFRLSTERHARVLAVGIWILAGLGAATAEQLPVRVYDIHDGLAGDSVTRILQDSRGYLWFATADGVSRFDGERFRSYGIQDGLPHARVHALLETRDKVYWAGTQGGLARYDPASASAGPVFAPVPLEAVPRGPVHTLYEDRAGRLWIGGEGYLAVLDRRGRAAARPVGLGALGPSPGRVAALAETPDGSLWVGTERGLLRILPDGRSVAYPVLPHHGNDRIRDLAVDARGRLWIAHFLGAMVLWPEPAGSLRPGPGAPLIRRAREAGRVLGNDADPVRLPRAPGEVLAFVPDASTGWYAVHVARRGVWLATSRGLKAWDGRRFVSWGTENGLSEKALTAVAEDKDGNLWVGTQSRGALRVARAGFSSFTAADGLVDAQVTSLFQGLDGALYVQSGDMFEGKTFLQRFENGRFTAVTPRMPGPVYLGWGQQQTALQDRSGQWWLATGQGLMRYPASAGFGDLAATPPRIFTRRDGLGGDSVLRLYEDRHGDLWVGTERGLSRWQPATDTFRAYGPEDGLPADEASAFAEDRAGQLGIGFASAGLVRRRGERFERFGEAQGVPEGTIQSLYVDRGGRLWLALRDGGVARVDGPAAALPGFTRYTTRDGLASDDVRCITEDAWGRLYLGGRKGVDRLDPARNRIDHFTAADGLVSNVIDVALRDRDGTLWFGTRRGLSRLVPQRQPPPPAPAAWITAVHVDGLPRPVSELGAPLVPGLELDSDRRRLEIEFLGLSFAPGAVMRYQHRLEGVDSDWSAPAPERSVQYAHPRAGRYRFLVRAVTRDGLVSPTPAELSLVVHPPLWRRGWVIALAVAALGAAAAGLYRYRVAHLLEIERMRTGIATDLHDDLGSSLSRISILSEVARRRVAGDAESVRLLHEIGESAREMIGALNENIWAIDPRRDNLRSLTTHLRRFAGDLLEGRDIAWQLRAPQDGELVKLSPVERRQLFLIAKEALHNAARHSGAGSVAIDLALAGRGLTLEIRDDGRGFQPGAPGEGRNGLRSMQARAATLGARLEIDSAPGRGTRLFLDAPIAT
jgi:ligand-binding sensor domain-containing protein/signal transduction histidine kinase